MRNLGLVYLYLCISREYPSTSSTILWVPSFLVLILNPPSLFHLISGVGIPWARHVNRAVSSCSLQYKTSCSAVQTGYSAVHKQLFCSIKPVFLHYINSYSAVQNQLFCSTKPVILQYKTFYSAVHSKLFWSTKPVILPYKNSYSAVKYHGYSAVQNQFFCIT